MGKSVDTRGKIAARADQFYVSPYLLRPLRRLEDVEREAALKKKEQARTRAAPPAADRDPAAGRERAGIKE